MKLFLSPQLALIACLPCVWGSVTTDTVIEACLTKYAPVSIKGAVPSTTTTVTVHQTATCQSTSIPTRTIQASPTTITSKSTTLVTVTTTLANTLINTFTSTTTVASTVDVTNTITTAAPAVTVSVTVTPTTTIPTSPGFIYASDSPNYDKKRAVDVSKDDSRRSIPRAEKLPAVRRAETQTKSSSSEKCYPTAVTCGVLIDVISTTTKIITGPTSTITAMSTATQTSVVTSTLTSSYLPAGASTTITVTTTLQITSTLTSTVTQDPATLTATVSLAAATYYAACSDQNLVTGFYGSYFDPPDTGVDGDPFIVLNTDNAYDCCVACQQNGDCGGAIFDDRDGTCTIDQPTGSCNPQGGSVQYYADLGSFDGITLIDGPCGTIFST